VLRFDAQVAARRTRRQAPAGEPPHRRGDGVRRPLGLEGDSLRRSAAGARVPRRGVPPAARGGGARRTASRRPTLRFETDWKSFRLELPGSARKHLVTLHHARLRHAARARRRQGRALPVVQAPRPAARTPRALRPHEPIRWRRTTSRSNALTCCASCSPGWRQRLPRTNCAPPPPTRRSPTSRSRTCARWATCSKRGKGRAKGSKLRPSPARARARPSPGTSNGRSGARRRRSGQKWVRK
jgi:hypothetical protein